ncbi:MAG: hypothetical protein WC378_07155 [Opitutaceae bacterium]
MQHKALEADYAMRGGIASVRVRKAMLIYTLAQLQIERNDEVVSPRLQLLPD